MVERGVFFYKKQGVASDCLLNNVGKTVIVRKRKRVDIFFKEEERSWMIEVRGRSCLFEVQPGCVLFQTI